MQKSVIRCIRFYQRWISAALPSHCRFEPSCSSYTAEAVETHGAARGLLLGIKRVLKCQPFHSGGYDPVPCAKSDAMHLSRPGNLETEKT